MRLIDAEALKEKVKSFCGETMARGFGKTTLSMAWELIGMFVDEIPTAEAKPVVHAHWEKHLEHQDDHFACWSYSCSNCNELLFSSLEHSKYCSNCGALMDEKEGAQNG